jgi:hypothetical protein
MLVRMLALTGALLSSTSCSTLNSGPAGGISYADLFQLHTAPDGRIYRIDTRTGKTSWLDGGTFREVAEPSMPQLVRGKVYRGEDGKTTYRYSGDGRLEEWA